MEVLKKIWPEWEIEGKPLGKGSFGVVYKAVRRDHNVESYAAIKVISIPADPAEVTALRSEGMDLNATRTYLQGIVDDFVSEIQLMESLKGIQNIVSVEDYKVVERVGEVGWDICIRMELLTPFSDFIVDRKLTEKQVIKLGLDICTALEICAKRNIIHRDIKPENIFLNSFGHFKLGDFGIARKMENVTGELSQKGSPNYMAPEVANRSEYDSRVDIYSLGIVLYRLLNENRLPLLRAETAMNPNERRNAVERRIRGEALPAPCEASPEMADLILRACAFDPNRRFASATEMKRALISVANGTYQMAGGDSLDKTAAVRKTASDLDGTATMPRMSAPPAANKASAPRAQRSPQEVYSFGKKQKKKSKAPAVIAIVLVLLLLAGAAIMVLPNLLNKDGSEDGVSGGIHYSKYDEEQIATLVEEADALAAEKDFEGALVKVETGLLVYPQSEILQQKSEEYTAALEAQIKETTLSEAAARADEGDYIAAMAILQKAMDTQGADPDYQAAYDTYNQAQIDSVKADAIAEADALAEEGDYVGAIEIVEGTIVTVGEDEELTAKSEAYKDAYAADVLEQVDALMEEDDLATARELLRQATEIVPENEDIQAYQEELNSYQTTYLHEMSPVNGGFTWNSGQPGDPFGNTYEGVQNYTIFPAEYSSKTYTAEYQVNRQYDVLSFKVTPYSDCEQAGWSYVRIYADGVLRYTSNKIAQKTQPYSISVDISDATYIKIVMVTSSKYGSAMMTDVVLTKSPDFTSDLLQGYTALSSLDVFNGSLPWNSYYPSDMLKSSYNHVCNYAYMHAYWCPTSGDHPEQKSYSIEYYVNKKYETLSFDIAPASDFDEEATAVVSIYADDVLVYTSSDITQKTARFNTGAIDISNATYIKIVSNVGNYGCLLISDAMLKDAT